MNIVKDDDEKKEIVFKNEISLRAAADGVYAIMRNGYDCNCPYATPMRIAKPASGLSINGGQPETQIIHPACMSTCPLFQMEENKDKTISVTIGCGNAIYKSLKIK
jgi:hypothetical protein